MSQADDKLLTRNLDSLRELVTREGYILRRGRQVPYGYRYDVVGLDSSVPITCYTSGRISVQGRASNLKSRLDAWKAEREAEPAPSEEHPPARPLSVWLGKENFVAIKSVCVREGLRFDVRRPQSEHEEESLVFEVGNDRVVLNFYRSGRAVVHGRHSELRTAVEREVRRFIPGAR